MDSKYSPKLQGANFVDDNATVDTNYLTERGRIRKGRSVNPPSPQGGPLSRLGTTQHAQEYG